MAAVTVVSEKRWQTKIIAFGQAAQYLFNNPLLSDIQFTCKDSNGESKLIYAHSFVLVLRSPVFYDEFCSCIGKQQKISIVEFTYEIFLSFMRYIYEVEFVFDEKNAFELFNAGEKYEVDCLVNDYHEFIANIKLSVENVCEYLELSLKVENTLLKENAIRFIGIYGKQIIKSESFKCLSAKALKEILVRDEEIFQVSEIQIFESVMKWAEHQCIIKSYNVNPINMRRLLGELIKLIRFTAMSTEEFANCIETYEGILSTDEDRSIVFSIIRKRTDSNELGFLRPRELNLDYLEEKELLIGDGKIIWKKYSKSHSKFRVNSSIYLTEIWISQPKFDFSIGIVFGQEGGTILYKDQQVSTDNKCWVVFTFTKPIKLLAGQQYYCDVLFMNNANMDFACPAAKSLPFTKIEDGITFTFTNWSPLFGKICFKQFK